MSRSALSVVEQKYGSLEELAYHILESKDEALDESLSLTERADAVDLPVMVFARVLQDPMFRQLLRADMVNKSYGLTEEEYHVRHMVKVAMGEQKTVVSNKGHVVLVDQAPTDVIAAGKYLNELRGTPVETKKDSAFKGVVVNFENVTVNVGKAEGDEPITLEAEVHRPRRAGDLPSAAVPTGGAASVPLPGQPRTSGDSLLGDFYGDSAREKDEADALAQKQQGETPDGREEVRPLRRRGKWPGALRRLEKRAQSVEQASKRPYDD